MNWDRWLAALVVMLALVGCVRVEGQTPHAPYSHEDNRNLHNDGTDM